MLPDLRPSKIREMQQMVAPQSVNLGLGQPIVETPPELVEVVDEVMHSADLGYTAFQGIPKLRETIASHVIGPGGKAENVCVTVGTTEAFFAAMMTLLDQGDEVLIPNPGFVSYQAVTQIAGATPKYYAVPATDGFKLSLEQVESMITDRTKVLVINSPNNPTGRIIDQHTLKQLGRLADKYGFYILSEEVYRDINFSGKASSAWGTGENVVVIDGISKIYAMTGWRLGWIIGETELIKRITTMHHYMVACAPAIAQEVLLKLYEDNQRIGTLIRNKLHHEYNRRRHRMVERLSQDLDWEYIPPDGAFYLMLGIPGNFLNGRTSEQIAKQMASEEDVITIPGSAFGDQGEGYLRLSFAVTEETIDEGITRIQRFAERNT